MFGSFVKVSLAGVFGILAAAPSSTNFTLKSYEFGTGGESSSSTNYALQSISGEQATDLTSSTNYKAIAGMLGTEQASVPPAPTLTNPSNEYTRLRLVVNTGSNPSDTLYQVAISTDNFATTNYVQTDFTVGTTNTLAQYQTSTSWGGVTGVWVVGLTQNTTYQVKVRALQGDFTGSAFGPTATAATQLPTLTFSVATSASVVPPFTVGFTGLATGVVTSGAATAELGLTTNSSNGGIVYIRSNGSLFSAAESYGITSADADLSIASSGYGALVTSAGQSSGGPIAAVAPYNGSGNTVGALTTSLRQLLSTAAPIVSGTASVTLKAKVDALAPAANDYTDTITFVAAMLY